MIKARIFNIMQYEKHPITGENLFDEDTIKIALAHKTIKQYAYIRHDKDIDDKGNIKSPHWHIVISCSNSLDIDVIAKWFKIENNFIDIPKGLGAGKFLDCVEYLTHEKCEQRQQGKYVYSDEEVKSNFDFREKLNKRNENRVKYGRDLSDIQQMEYDVMYLGVSLYECMERDRILYMENFNKLAKMRLNYIDRLEPPHYRINYYIYGKGGTGKDLISRGLARALFPDIPKDDNLFFVVGAGNSTFEGYDGQPVIIWSDKRASGLIRTLDGRENVFNVFDTHPIRQRQNVKYSSINLCNVVNIVNGQEKYTDFLDGLAGEYIGKDGTKYFSEDKGQSYRRFPFIIPLYDEDFDVLINKGYFEDNRKYFSEYMHYTRIRGNMQKIMIACGGEKNSKIITSKVVEPIVKKHNETVQKLECKSKSDEELERIMKENGWGEELPPREYPNKE